MVACIFGTIVINSADSSYTMKQVIGLIGCLGVMGVISLVDYHYFCKTWLIIYGFNLIMLLGLIPFGKTVNNAKRWYGIGNFMTIQPSEFTKIFMIICLAVLLTRAAAGLINNH